MRDGQLSGAGLTGNVFLGRALINARVSICSMEGWLLGSAKLRDNVVGNLIKVCPRCAQ